jgi:LPXTG-site transpeptidase (sortase) family protein
LPAPPSVKTELSLIEEGKLPERLIIPSIEVNAAFQHVGTTESGNMQAPTYYKDVAWFNLGTLPGEAGNAVVAGHLDKANGTPAAFFRLGELKEGDEVFVRDEKGEKLRFVVREAVYVDYENPPQEIMDRVFGASLEANLVLITCDGEWLPEEKTYANRLIVFADFSDKVE